jgi:cobaltochelatase CobS
MRKQRYCIARTFEVEVPPELEIEGLDDDHAHQAFVPDREAGYLFRRDLLSDVLAWLQFGAKDPLYLSGPTGSGKSSVVTQVAARLNLPVQRVTAHARMELPELVGQHVLVDGDLVFQDGPLTTALRYGHLFLLDELDLLDPATAAGLNGVIEGAPLVIPENGGEVVTPHVQFRFVATGNTAGAGDRTGLYQGTLRQNLAFMDRFWLVQVDYPEPEQERRLLAEAVPSLPDYVRERFVEVAGQVRALFMGEDAGASAIEVTLSTRTLLRWARLSLFFKGAAAQGKNPVLHALDRALTYRAEPQTREAIHQIVQRVFGEA